jgi:hypothetical protein
MSDKVKEIIKIVLIILIFVAEVVFGIKLNLDQTEFKNEVEKELKNIQTQQIEIKSEVEKRVDFELKEEKKEDEKENE